MISINEPKRDKKKSGPMRRVKHWLSALSLTGKIAVAVIAVFLAFGFTVLGQGLYIKAKAELAQVMLETAWSRTLAGETISKPWPWADMWPVARLEVPRLGESAIVLNSASGESMAFGPGHVSLTPMPGRGGTSVIAAHRDTHFEFLKDVKIGDQLHLTLTDGSVNRYEVKSFEVVDAEASGIEPHLQGSSKLALVTCWPFGAAQRGPLRYVVHSELRSFRTAQMR